MSSIKSYAVGNGDMFYIDHNSDNLSIIDCCLSDENKEEIIEEIKTIKSTKGITRFISTHPDQDHIRGLKYLDENIDVLNFYCVENKATKDEETDDFKHYCSLRDSKKVFYLNKDCTRRWMNLDSEERGSSGINILWPETDSEYFEETMRVAEEGGSPNNISPIIKYTLNRGAIVLWMGDLDTGFMESIEHSISWPKIDILFAPHHGRDLVPAGILEKLDPRVVILGVAPSEHLEYYDNYNTVTQNSAGDITLECIQQKVHFFVSKSGYKVDFLDSENISGGDNYIGTLRL
jgi:beta-lactamase superfamily II metal-dependent hydrolase